MKRTVKKQFWLSRDEAQELQKKAKRTCLSEADLHGEFTGPWVEKYMKNGTGTTAENRMRILRLIDNLHQLTVKANALGFLDMQKLNAEAERWHSFQADVERQFLRPEKSDLKWQ